MIDFEKVYEKETGKKARTIVSKEGSREISRYNCGYVGWLESSLAESTELLITEYKDILRTCKTVCGINSECDEACDLFTEKANAKAAIERNTGKKIEEVLK